jgi:hypothetical protein
VSDHAAARAERGASSWKRGVELVSAIAAWAWFVLAGCGGLGLIVEEGPWPLTHGWFAMFSGLSAWPVTAWASKKYLHIALSGPVRLGAAAAIMLAGRLAVDFLWPRPGQPVHQLDRIAIVCGIVLLITVLIGVSANSKKPGRETSA